MTFRFRVFTESPSSRISPEGIAFHLILPSDWKLVQSGVSLSRIQTLIRVSGRLSRLLTRYRDQTAETKRRLLVIDDEESICFSMSDYFTHHGFDVETANDLYQAERMINSGQYEVIIQDLRLGATQHPDGLDIIRLVNELWPETRIIVLTAYGSAEVESEAKASGADAFLRKPQPLSQVAQVVRGLIELPRRRRAAPSA